MLRHAAAASAVVVVVFSSFLENETCRSLSEKFNVSHTQRTHAHEYETVDDE